MNKSKFLFIGLLSVALVLGMMITNCGDAETWDSQDQLPELTRLTIGKVRVNNLGKPNKAPAKAEKGSVTLSTQNDEPPLSVTAPQITYQPVSNSIDVKFGVTSTDTPPANYSADMPDSLENGSYLWVQVTDTAKRVSAYYVIKITVKYSPLEVFAIKTHPASREFTLADWNSAASALKTLTVAMEIEEAAYQYQWYSNTAFSGEGGTAIPGETGAGYTPDIEEVGTYYYYVTVTLGDTLTSNPVMIRIVAESIEPAPTQFLIGDTRLNYVRGVGGTGSFMFRAGSNADASPDADVRYIDLLMGELGCNILRIMVQDEYENYLTNAVQSRNQNVFFHNARDNFFPVIRKVNEYGGYVFANPWTAPASMKIGNSLIGGNLTQTGQNYVDYAEHLRNFLKWLNTNDAPIFALGILNEPDFGGGANYEGMGMSATVTRDWFMTVGNFPTQRVTNRSGAGTASSLFEEDIIPGYGGGKPTHHVLAMSGDTMGDIASYMNSQLDSTGANNKIELMGRHYYANAARYTRVVGSATTAWNDRPQLSYTGPYEAASLAISPQMYAPGSAPGNVKREVWQTEHDFNYHSNSTTPPASNVQNFWNSAFAALNDVDWCLRVVGESVFCWWYSSSYSGLVTSYQAAGFPPYTITPRGRAFAHYARYVNETWFLPISRTRGTINFNTTSINFNAGATDPKISAFEDVNGKFISVVMYTPSTSTSSGQISNSFGQGGTVGNDDPTRGSANVGRIAVVLPDGFTASGASAIRSYGNANADGQTWDNVPSGSPRYWIDEPVFLSANGQSVEVTLPGGNIISIMIRGEWASDYLALKPRHFEERPRPYTVK
ncbi:MAG: hypothetical protein LBH20_00610 [Treponema sp.]|jgi:hypothetical protein|nr:hypothetical protein [Treponema sp.]